MRIISSTAVHKNTYTTLLKLRNTHTQAYTNHISHIGLHDEQSKHKQHDEFTIRNVFRNCQMSTKSLSNKMITDCNTPDDKRH